MSEQRTFRNVATALALSLSLACAAPASAQEGAPEPRPDDEDTVTRLLTELAKPDQPGWQQIEQSIILEWSKSGSPAMDLLLQRGRDALEEDEIEQALEHLTALTDHAPEFAEGWNARATAFFRADQYGLAMADLSRALELEPRHFGAMIGLATILREVDRPEDALAVLRRAHAIHPHRPNVNDGIERLAADLEGEAL